MLPKRVEALRRKTKHHVKTMNTLDEEPRATPSSTVSPEGKGSIFLAERETTVVSRRVGRARFLVLFKCFDPYASTQKRDEKEFDKIPQFFEF